MKAPIPSPLGDDVFPSPPEAKGLFVSPEAATIIYRTRFGSELRNHLLFALLHPVALSMMLGAATVFSLFSNRVFGLGLIPNFALRWAANFALLMIVNTVVSTVNILNARSSTRGETMTLWRHELEYTSPVKTRHIKWSQVKFIFDAMGFLYFVRWDGITYVPHAAFQRPDERQLWLEAARVLQKSQGAAWPEELVAQMMAQSKRPR
jgi:hypothetical protein